MYEEFMIERGKESRLFDLCPRVSSVYRTASGAVRLNFTPTGSKTYVVLQAGNVITHDKDSDVWDYREKL